MNDDLPLTLHSFPRAVLHIDGDAFFASCEQARDPQLQGKPVITGKERGIASSMSYEAKARGVTRGMRLFEIKRLCPDAVILPSDYETYSLLSQRLFAIVRRYTPEVEEYSIDEVFADLTGLRRPLRMSYEQMAAKIKHELDTELGFTFSVGLAPNKVLAKIASKWQKPSGFTAIPGHTIFTCSSKNCRWARSGASGATRRRSCRSTAYVLRSTSRGNPNSGSRNFLPNRSMGSGRN
jgi:DNA polymerase-4/DNA polymerase V